jgi:MFS family permease
MVAPVIRRPSFILALLTALNLLNYLDRFILAAVLPKVQDDLHLSYALAGGLFTVFLIGYFATSPIFGIVADRAGPGGRKALLALGIGIWSVATIASGLARSATAMVAARAVVGVGEASYATISPALIDDVAPADQKGRWMAIFSAAVPIGSAMGYLLGGVVLGMTGNWRDVFLVAGGPGLALALLCLLIHEPPQHSSPPSPFESVRTLSRLPLYLRAVSGFCAYTFAIGGFAALAVSYTVRRYGLETGRASTAFGLVTVIAGFLGTLIGGWMGDAAARARVRGAAFPCEVALFLLSGPFTVTLLRSVPAELRASAMALCIFACHLFGDLSSPFLIGKITDVSHSFEGAMFGIPVAYALAALIWWGGRRALPSG